MGGFGELWDIGVVGSLADALIFLTTLLSGNYGLAIIVFTIAVKLVLLPLTIKQIKSSKAMMEIQPQIQALQKKYGKDREKLMQEQMRLYKENKVNPAAGCLPLLVQMPVWFGLYQALFRLAQIDFAPAQQSFLWIANLAQPEPMPWLLAITTGASQWVTQRMMMPRSTDPQQKMMNQMMQFMPIMFIFFAFSVPAGLVLYWVTSNLFTFVQQYFTTGWGSLSLPKSFSLPALLGAEAEPPRATKYVKAKSSAPAIEPPSSNGSKTADTNAASEEEAINRARGHSEKRKKGRRR
ncbi:MAG: membrane protein insertase YidC [Chloroflexi bacterium]|nr:membrane protein insertase YidC [Chloroflexota bacterium]